MDDVGLAFASATEQAELVRDGTVSPTQLVDLYLGRIEAIDPRLDSYLTVAADQARDAARAAEQRLATDKGDLPPFLGVPISIKDLNDTAGIRTTHGTATWKDRVPEHDDETVARLKHAGFVVIGKTNTPEFGSRSTTESPGYPTARNPWDPARTPGGSSGGAGAALAAGLCPIAQGSDGGGSIRIPSAWCGLYGLKPSRGRVSHAPGPQSWNATNGPIARTVRDAAAMLDVIEGYATGDAWWLSAPPRPFADEVGASPGRLRIAWTTAHPDADEQVQREWREGVERAVATLEACGHALVEAAPPAMDVATSALIPASSIASRPDLPPVDTLDMPNRTLVELSAAMTTKDLGDAIRLVQTESRRVIGFFEEYDVLITPTIAAAAPLIGEKVIGDADFAGLLSLLKLIAFTPIWNMTGQPGASVPAGFDTDGLPVGVQVVGRPGDETTVIRVSAQLEEAQPWRDARPGIS